MISIVKYNKCITGEHNIIETSIELSKSDVEELDGYIRKGTLFEKIIELEAISYELYQDLRLYLETENINRILRQKGSDKIKIIRTSNKLLLAYCASVKMLVDKIESYIKHNCSKEEFEDFKKFRSKIYDENISYRFIVRLRNYMIHYDMPITIAKVSVIDDCQLCFNKEELLKSDVWSKVRDDIKKMPMEIDALPLLSDMPRLLKLIVDESRYYYAPTVSNACKGIEAFAKKHNTESVMYITYDESKGIASGTISTPPMNIIEKNLAILQQHPRINVVYHINNRVCKTELVQAKSKGK